MLIPRTSLSVLSLVTLMTATALRAAPVVPPLVDPPTNRLVPGRFVWGDLFSVDPAASTGFYTKLFGWTSRKLEAEGRSYTVLLSGGRPIGGIAQGPPAPENSPGARWIAYISVPDTGKAADAVVAAKGRLVAGPRPVPERGVHAIVADSEGALFGLMTSSAGDPEDFLPEINEWMWLTLFARDPGAAIAFYRAVAGWEEQPDERTEYPDDYILSSGGHARAGLCRMSADSRQDSAWVGFVRVNDIKEMVARATELGGRSIIESGTGTPGEGIAILADPLGGLFGVAAFPEQSETNP